MPLQRVVDGRPAAARPGPGRQPRHLLVDVAELTQQRLHLGLDGLHRVLAPAAQQRGLVTVRVPDMTLHLHNSYLLISCEDIISPAAGSAAVAGAELAEGDQLGVDLILEPPGRLPQPLPVAGLAPHLS